MGDLDGLNDLLHRLGDVCVSIPHGHNGDGCIFARLDYFLLGSGFLGL